MRIKEKFNAYLEDNFLYILEEMTAWLKSGEDKKTDQ